MSVEFSPHEYMPAFELNVPVRLKGLWRVKLGLWLVAMGLRISGAAFTINSEDV